MTSCSSAVNARRPLRRRAWLAGSIGALALVAHACEKVPLLAPSGSAISLSATTAAALSTDAVQITALVLEGAAGATPTTGNATPTNTAGAGQPVHNGTHVTFTSNIGHVSPADATTVNGRVTVTFTGDGQAGKATITATSGAAVKTLDITLTAPSGSD